LGSFTLGSSGQRSLVVFGSPDISLDSLSNHHRWQPSIGQFGVLPLVNATLMTSFFAMLIALPLGLSAAIYLSEYASPRPAAPSNRSWRCWPACRPWYTATLP
jgi:ABC-type phosphate transport system permease subunit